ncbi:MAG: hypothetical protein IKC57_03575 [Alistipes sp.]|nr:hypothetical protein [Alistipes sp.]
METRNKEQINEHRSIEIISQMIAATKSDIDRESGKYFLLWGYTTVLVSLFEFFAQTGGMDSVACAWCWWLIPLVGGVGTLWLSHRASRGHAPRPKSHLDRSVSAVWQVFGLSWGMVLVAALAYGTNILFLTIVMMGMGTVITGKICQHRVLTISGKLSMLLSLIFPAHHLLMREYGTTLRDSGFEHFEYLLYGEIIIFALIFTVMMIVPGHILYNRAKRLHNA